MAFSGPAYNNDSAAAAKLTFTIAVLMMLAPFSIDSYLPSLPDIAREFGAPDWQVQQTLSLYLLAFAGTTLIYGPLSDAFGRRSVVMGTLGLYALTSIGCGFATNIEWLLVMRIGQGLTASGAVVIGRAIVRDAFSGAHAQRVMSQIMLFFSLAPAVAPIIGGYLHEAYGWRSVFWFLTAVALLLCGWTAWRLPETLSPANRNPAYPRALAVAYGRALAHGRFMLLILSIAFCFGGLFLYIAGSPALLYQHLGYGAGDFGYLFVPVVAGLMGGAYLSGRLAGHFSHAHAVKVGFGFIVTATVFGLAGALWLTPRLWSTVGPVMLYAAGMALTIPNLSLIALDCMPQRRGLASAIQSFTQMTFGGIVAGVIVPLVADRLWTFALADLVLGGIAFGFWTLSDRRGPNAPTP
jgi:DHA1 family bicyclomycin/chloramphenicol resistance-like MFS transporter